MAQGIGVQIPVLVPYIFSPVAHSTSWLSHLTFNQAMRWFEPNMGYHFYRLNTIMANDIPIEIYRDIQIYSLGAYNTPYFFTTLNRIKSQSRSIRGVKNWIDKHLAKKNATITEMKSFKTFITEDWAESKARAEQMKPMIEALKSNILSVVGNGYVVQAGISTLGGDPSAYVTVHSAQYENGIWQNAAVIITVWCHDVKGFDVPVAWEGSDIRKEYKYRKISAANFQDSTSKLVDWFRKVKPFMDTVTVDNGRRAFDGVQRR